MSRFTMTNSEIAKLLRQIAAAYAIFDEKKYRFQIIAYQKASDTIDSITTDLKILTKEGKLDELPGIGSSIKSYLQELFTTGKVQRFDTVLREIPPSVFPLLDIPSFGPKKSYRLVSHFQLNNPTTAIDDLADLAKKGKIANLDGFGEKSQQDIIRAINEYKLGLTKSVRMNLPFANELAERMISYLKKSNDVINAFPLGSLRRKKDTIGDVDIAVSTNDPKKVIKYFTDFPHKERILEQGDISAGLIVGGKHIDLMAIDPERFGSLLQHFTGSKNHNVHLREYALKKGLSLSEKGIKEISTGKMRSFKTEEDFYKALGFPWIPPEIREDTGEIELALINTLPKLIEFSNIKGDFHLHSSFPIEPSHDMGQSTMEEMVKKAVGLNYEYIGFSEHNPSKSKHTVLQTGNILKKRMDEINRLRLKYKNIIRILSLLEVDILPDGSLAIDEKNTKYLDAMLVSIHSVFNMDKSKMTERVLKGLSHPKAKILTHPTGRLINQRLGYELDWEKIFKYCRSNHKALEINAFPSRLDLPDTLVRKAIKEKVVLTINTDSHAKEQMDLMQYGVSVARRGWATSSDILNTWSYNEIEKWFNK